MEEYTRDHDFGLEASPDVVFGKFSEIGDGHHDALHHFVGSHLRTCRSRFETRSIIDSHFSYEALPHGDLNRYKSTSELYDNFSPRIQTAR